MTKRRWFGLNAGASNWLWLGAVVLVLDQWTKALIVERLQEEGDKIVLLPTSGGSLPLSIITERLKTVAISVPIANYDNNQHAENENIRIQNLWDGIETWAAIMTMK